MNDTLQCGAGGAVYIGDPSDMPNKVTQVFHGYYGVLPSALWAGHVTLKSLTKLTDEHFVPLTEEASIDKGKMNVYFRAFKHKTKEILIYVSYNQAANYVKDTVYVSVLYNIPEQATVLEYHKSLIPARKKPKPKDQPLYTIGILLPSMGGGLDIKFFELNFDGVSMGNYCESVRNGYPHIIQTLKEGKKGLHLFTGEPGTGKTNLLKKLAHDLNGVKDFVFISADNAELLGHPHLVQTLLVRRNLVLIIEDGESSIAKRDIDHTIRTKYTSNLLNITDGIMSDILQAQVIITLNCSEDKIDEAFLREGRLTGKFSFDALSEDDAVNWCIDNKLSAEIDKPIKLCDLYSMLKQQQNEKAKSGQPGSKSN